MAVDPHATGASTGSGTGRESGPGTGAGSGPGADPASGSGTWRASLAEHPAWSASPDLVPVRDTVLAVVDSWATRYAAARERTVDDPWWDDTFATRALGHAGWLLDQVLGAADADRQGAAGAASSDPDDPSSPPLPADAVLALLLLPFAHQTYWAVAAAERSGLAAPVSGPGSAQEHRINFERFVAGSPRLARRAGRLFAGTDPADGAAARPAESPVAGASAGTSERTSDGVPAGPSEGAAGGAADGRAIRWWLLHRWLARDPDRYDTARVAEVLADPPAAVPLATLAGLLRTLHHSDTSAGPSPAPTPAVQLLARLAHRMAVEPISLPDLIADHVGIADPVRPAELRDTLRSVRWWTRGRTLVLDAGCAHQAVDAALTEHVAGVGGVLARLDALAEATGGDPGDTPGPALRRGLAALPAHASADGVGPLTGAEGVRAYDGHGFRFRLADDRVQELLMGEQLYGDRALAIRELYQNALDACRYRAARTTYLERTGAHPPEWTGRISFVADTDRSGRPYLDCIDNGIGMGSRELIDVFSNAGVRFADLPEFIQEQAEWARHDIHLYPNSRFGIGVLSYFMLADEITVTTCRADPDGRPGRQLRVSIAGPGTLARIQDLGPGTDPGTTIRLHLRPGDTPTSAVDLLRRLLWITPFEVSAADDTGALTWIPGKLSEVAPLGHDDPTDTAAHRTPGTVLPTGDSNVWWSDGQGAVLADGLWAGTHLFGAVVNLSGSVAPQLTVDRRGLVRHDRAVVRRLLTAQVPVLADAGTDEFDADWLLRLAKADPELADEVGVQLMARHRRWGISPQDADLAEVGCFPMDARLFGTKTKDSNTRSLPDVVAGWRLRTWARAGALPGVAASGPPEPVAGPSDQLLLSVDLDGAGPWLDRKRKVRPGQVLRAALRLGRAPKTVADRMADLGLRVPQRDWPTEVEESDLVMVSADLDGKPTWLPGEAQVRPGHVLAAAHRLGRAPAQVAQRLRELGLDVPSWEWPASAERVDVALLSRRFTGGEPWARPGRAIPDVHVIIASALTGRPGQEIATFLARFGLSTADRNWPSGLDQADLVLLSRDLDSRTPWVGTRPVPRGHVFAAAVKLGTTPAAVAARLADLGVPVADGPDWPPTVSATELVMLSRDGDGRSPWLDSGSVIEPGRMMNAMGESGMAPAQVAARLAELGMAVAADTWPDTLDDADLVLLSQDRDRRGPWLPVGKRVPRGHEVASARECNRSPDWIRDRLIAYGLRPSRRGKKFGRTDRLLFSQDLDGKRPYYTRKKIPFGHILAVAVEQKRSPQAVAERAAQLGFRVVLAEGMSIPDRVTRDEVKMLSRDVDGEKPWLSPRRPVPDTVVLRVAAKLRRSPADVAARLAALGYTVPGERWPDAVSRSDLVLLSRDLDAIAPWLDKVSAAHLIAASGAQKATVGEVLVRLQELGLSLPKGIRPA
ncbi:MAG: hypothetical protein P8Z68_00665 [Kineosporiaceae bacterium]